MTAREYLGQGYRLQHQIDLLQEEIAQLRDLSTSVSSPGFEEHYNASRKTEAPYEKILLYISDLEKRYSDTLSKLLKFRAEMISVINGVSDKDERLVLHYRYVCNYTWIRIGEVLGWDERTIRRWHNKALSSVVLPEHPMIVDENLKKIS